MKPNLNYNDFFNEDTGQEPGEIIKINDSLQYCILLALILKWNEIRLILKHLLHVVTQNYGSGFVCCIILTIFC